MTVSARIRQVLLLLFGVAVGILAMFQMFMRVSGEFPHDYLVMCGELLVLLAVNVAVIFHFQRYADLTILAVVVTLALIGITMITRIDLEARANGVASSAGSRQFGWFLMGLGVCALMFVCIHDYRIFRRFSYVCMVIGLVLLLSPMIPHLGMTLNGARIWIHFGSHTIQPAEFAKLFLAIFFASYLFDHRDQLTVGGKKIGGIRLPRLKDLGPILVVWGVSMGVLVMQKDLGTGLMFFAMFVCMLYLATGQRSWAIIGLVFFCGSAYAAYTLFTHVQGRVASWLHPFDAAVYQAEGGSQQLVTGVFGLSSGGLFGTGLGQGMPGLTPLGNSDFIYDSLGEELGLVGVLAILMLYLCMVVFGILTALRCKDGFGKLLAAGLMFSMAFQVFTVVGGNTLLIPLTGLTLPYMAAGGSSMMANLMLASLVIIVNNGANTPQVDASDSEFQQEALEVIRNAQKEAAAAAQRGQEARHAQKSLARGAAVPGPSAKPAGEPEYDDEPAIVQTSRQSALTRDFRNGRGAGNGDAAGNPHYIDPRYADEQGEDPALLDLGFDYSTYPDDSAETGNPANSADSGTSYTTRNSDGSKEARR